MEGSCLGCRDSRAPTGYPNMLITNFGRRKGKTLALPLYQRPFQPVCSAMVGLSSKNIYISVRTFEDHTLPNQHQTSRSRHEEDAPSSPVTRPRVRYDFSRVRSWAYVAAYPGRHAQSVPSAVQRALQFPTNPAATQGPKTHLPVPSDKVGSLVAQARSFGCLPGRRKAVGVVGCSWDGQRGRTLGY